MDTRKWLIRLVALSVVGPVAACADRDDGEIETDMEVEEAPATEPAPGVSGPMTITLQPMNDATLTGEAIATHGADEVNLQVRLTGLVEGPDYEAALRHGTCVQAQTHFDARGGTDVVVPGEPAPPGTSPLLPALGDEIVEIELEVTGTTGTGTAEIDADELGPDEEAYLAVEIDDDVGGDKLVACADLRGHGGR